MGDAKNDDLRVGFDGRLKWRSRGTCSRRSSTASNDWQSRLLSPLAAPNSRFHYLKYELFEGELRANESIDARKHVGCASSEANGEAAEAKCREKHYKFDSVRA